MNYNSIISAIFLLFASLSLSAQDDDFAFPAYEEGDQLWGFGYSIGFPSEKFNEFIEETSFRGFHLDYDYFVIDNLSVGFNGSYTLYNQIDERASYNFEAGNTGAAVSAKIWRYTHLVPLQATTRYYFSPTADSWAHLFGGVGMGITYINQEVWVGLSTFREESWRFSMTPEFGLDISTDGRYNIQLSGQYLYIPNGLQLVEENNLESWNLKIGFRKWIF